MEEKASKKNLIQDEVVYQDNQLQDEDDDDDFNR